MAFGIVPTKGLRLVPTGTNLGMPDAGTAYNGTD